MTLNSLECGRDAGHAGCMNSQDTHPTATQHLASLPETTPTPGSTDEAAPSEAERAKARISLRVAAIVGALALVAALICFLTLDGLGRIIAPAAFAFGGLLSFFATWMSVRKAL